MKLVINESDFEPDTQATLRLDQGGQEVLADNEDAERKIWDALPGVIAQRLKEIVPPEFTIREFQINMTVGAKLWGVGVDAEVCVTLAPPDKGET